MKKHMFMINPASLHKQEVTVACTVIPKKHNTRLSIGLMQAKAGSDEQIVCPDCNIILFANNSFCGCMNSINGL